MGLFQPKHDAILPTLLALLAALTVNEFTLAASAESPTKAETRSTVEAQRPPSAPRWGLNVSSGRFDFAGTEAARGNSYSFDRILVESQNVGFSFKKTPQLTFAVGGKYLQNYSELRAGTRLFKSNTEGWGDTLLTATQVEALDPQQTLVSTIGVQVPTGEVTIKNPRKVNVNHPYYLQTGSGTTDFYGALTYQKAWSTPLRAGALASALVRTGRNEVDYRRGSEYSASLWSDWVVHSAFTPGLRLNYKHIGKLAGVDASLGRNEYTEYYHSPQNNWDFGVTMKGAWPLKVLGNTNLTYAASLPVAQRLKNIVNLQVETKYTVTAGLQATF